MHEIEIRIREATLGYLPIFMASAYREGGVKGENTEVQVANFQ